VYALFKVISNKELFSLFKEKLDLTPYSRDLRKKYIDDLKLDLSILERAYKFFYVNRTSFNGSGGFTSNLEIRRNMSKSVSDYLIYGRLPS
jgi:site-specific DNA-adenine methylase